MLRLLRRLGNETVMAPDPLPAYAAMGHWSVSAAPLEGRLELLVALFSAELSACAWCLSRARHRWRAAFLPEQGLRELRGYSTSPSYSERERAALALTEAVARYRSADPSPGREALIQARRHFQEPQVARIVQAAAGEHFFNPATGMLGLDAGLGDPAAADTAWSAIARGLTVRGWL